MNGVDRILEAEYAKQLAEEAAAIEFARKDALPKSLVMGVGGYEYKHVRETPTYPLLNIAPPDPIEIARKKQLDPFNGMSVPYHLVNPHYPEMSQKALYTKEYLMELMEKRNNGPKRSVGVEDFGSERVRNSFK